MDKERNKLGRPYGFTKELADIICEEIALGNSLRSVCRRDDMPCMASVFKWLRENPSFTEQYEKACAERTEAMAEDTLDIADNGNNDWMATHSGDNEAWKVNGEAIQRSRLRVDTRKWLMSKMKPKKYGDRIDMTTNGKELPTPLLYAIRDNNSNTQDSKPEGKN